MIAEIIGGMKPLTFQSKEPLSRKSNTIVQNPFKLASCSKLSDRSALKGMLKGSKMPASNRNKSILPPIETQCYTMVLTTKSKTLTINIDIAKVGILPASILSLLVTYPEGSYLVSPASGPRYLQIQPQWLKTKCIHF